MRVLGLLISLLWASSVAAQSAERLVVTPYPAATPWEKVTDQRQGLRALQEWIPADQTLENYRDILAVNAYPLPPGQTPEGYLKGLFRDFTAACSGLRVNGPFARSEGGYPVAYAQAYCGQQKGEAFGVNMFFKVIQGRDALYAVNRDLRVPPSSVGGVQSFDKKDMARMVDLMKRQGEADKFLSEGIYLCGPDGSDPRCQSTNPH